MFAHCGGGGCYLDNFLKVNELLIMGLYLDFFQLCSRGCQPAGFPGVWSAPVCAASPQGGRRNEMVEIVEMVEPRGDNQNSNYG